MSEYEDIQEQLSAYLDGELSDEDARRVESALAENANQAAELEQLRRTRELVQSLPREQVGEDFAAKVVQAAARQGSGPQTWRPASWPSPWRRYFAAAALIVFAVGLGLFFSALLYKPEPEPGPYSELAIKSPEDMDAAGTVTRNLDELRGVADEKTDERVTASAESLEEAKAEPTEAETSPSPAVPPPATMLKDTIAKKPAERPAAKGAPRRRRSKSFAGKIGLRHVSRKGPSEPYDRPAAFLSGPQPTEELAKLVAPTDNEIIYTDDLSAGQKQVEAVFLANAVEITPPTRRVLQPNQANLYQASPANRKAEAQSAPPPQLQYVVYGTEDRLRRVRAQLDSDVRARQTAAQLPVVRSRRNDQARSMPVGGKEKIQADEKQRKPVSRQFAQTAEQSPSTTLPSQRQKQIRARLLSNQAMLVTLKVHPAAEK